MRFERFRNCLCALLPALCAALLLPACAAKEDGGDAPNDMTISVSLRDVHRCSRISPEIQLANAPADADYFDVRLVEYTGDSQELFLGGGSWDNDGSGVIPEGGLTRHYRGPCPPTAARATTLLWFRPCTGATCSPCPCASTASRRSNQQSPWQRAGARTVHHPGWVALKKALCHGRHKTRSGALPCRRPACRPGSVVNRDACPRRSHAKTLCGYGGAACARQIHLGPAHS